jgi:anti-anti-sigma factor
MTPSRGHLKLHVVWTVGATLTGCPLDQDREGAMSRLDPAGFRVQVTPTGTLLLRGELDMATVQDLQDSIDQILVPGQPVILDLAQVTFLDSSSIPCLMRTWDASGHPVVLRNTSHTVRRILEIVDDRPHAWTFDQDGSGPASEMD